MKSRFPNKGARLLHFWGLLLLAYSHAYVLGSPEPEPGWLSIRSCQTGSGSDTLKPPMDLGSKQRLEIFRNGRALLRDQDWRWEGDSTLVLAEALSSQDTLCLSTYRSPLWASAPRLLRDTSEVPILNAKLWNDLHQMAGDGETDFNTSMVNTKNGPLSTPSWQKGLGHEKKNPEEYRLDFSGSKTLAVSMGEGGGLGLDATLFLNVKGQLAEDVFVEGRLSDQNVPLQPEGNTATLKEIDTKSIRLYGTHYEYLLGDFQLEHGREGLDRVNARVAGLQAQYGRGGWKAKGALARSEGIFHSDSLRGIDGQQRGYYLRGRDGQRFIRVLPGTERLWRNGEKLTRGTDYTIDYAEGRLDFLNRFVVTSENLFSAEYQYADQDYPRTLVDGDLSDTLGKVKWSLRAIHQGEDPDSPLGPAADSALRENLKTLGDGLLRDSLGREVRAPTQQDLQVADLEWLPDSNHTSKLSILTSRRDANLYSTKDDGDNLGYSTRYLGRQRLGKPFNQGGFGLYEADWIHEKRSENFTSFNPFIEPRTFRDLWNLDTRVGERGFDANRLQFAIEPFTQLRLQAEAGFAEGFAYSDTATAYSQPLPGENSKARRLALEGQAGDDRMGLSFLTESKRVQSPLRRDNWRQKGNLKWGVPAFAPQFSFERNEWISALPHGQTQSIESKPALNVLWQLPWEGFNFESGVNENFWVSDYNALLDHVADSARAFGLQQRVLISNRGPFSSEIFYSFQRNETWALSLSNIRSETPRTADYHLLETQAHWNQGESGLQANTGYRVSRTSELPLVDDYRKIEAGRGQYAFDSLLNAYHLVETGGDYVLVGLRRDTTLGIQPYQDVQWTADIDLTPNRFPFLVKGFLKDIDLSLQVSADLQDSGSDPTFFPLLADKDILAARSGHTHYQPLLRWQHPDGKRNATLQFTRDFSKQAGVYAYRERYSEYRVDWRHTLNDLWEYDFQGGYDSRERRPGTGEGVSTTEGQRGELRWQRKLPFDFLVEAALELRRVQGETFNESFDLFGWRPQLRSEKAFPSRGRGFLEYALQAWQGSGAGDYYATGGYAKGLTHRIESGADMEIQAYLFLHLSYLIRFEPNRREAIQRLSAEVRAVF